MSASILSHPDPSGVRLALAIVLFLVAANVPYAWLIANFGYDDILREPAARILEAFSDGGAALVLAWLAFSVGALLFIPVALEFRRMLAGQGVDGGAAAILGIGSAIAQATGLLRWVLVVPSLAAAYVQPGASDSAREAIVVAFDVVHRFGGMIVGELLGQLLLAAWTALTAGRCGRPRSCRSGCWHAVPRRCRCGCSDSPNSSTTCCLRSPRSRRRPPRSCSGKPGWLPVAVTMFRRALPGHARGAAVSRAC